MIVSKPFQIVIIALLLFLFFNCHKNPSSPENESLSFTGRIENWNDSWFQNKLYICVEGNSSSAVLDITQISTDGSFSIKLPFPTPPNSVLKSFTTAKDSNQYIVKQDKRIFSNPNSNYVLLRLKGHDTPKGLAFYLYAQNKSPVTDSVYNSGDYRIEYYYFTEPTTITGYYKITINTPYENYKHITTYNLDVSAGWNSVKTRIVFIDNQTCVYEITSEDVPNKNWFATSYILHGFENIPEL